jgi:hypothetical protein
MVEDSSNAETAEAADSRFVDSSHDAGVPWGIAEPGQDSETPRSAEKDMARHWLMRMRYAGMGTARSSEMMQLEIEDRCCFEAAVVVVAAVQEAVLERRLDMLLLGM